MLHHYACITIQVANLKDSNKIIYCIIQLLFRLQAAQTSRMDKADILELTVSYLKLMNFEECETARATQRQYKAGYTSCARVALKFIQESTTVNQIVKTNMEEFLTNRSCEPTQTDSSEYNRRLNGLNSTCNHVTQEPIHIQVPSASFSKSVPHFSTSTRINTLMLADQCVHPHKDAVQSRPYASSVDELSCALNIFGEIGTETTHPLNLSAASDSSLNGGDVWRPW